MKDQILKVTFPDGIDASDTEINFTTAKDWDDVNAAAAIIAGRIPQECGELEIPGLPEFLNTAPDDMGYLVCRETGETMSWGDLA